MFSTDRNIETIAQLVEELKKYATLKVEYYQLDLVEKAVRVITALMMAFVLAVLMLLIVVFFSLALSYLLSTYIGVLSAYLTVGGIYVVLLGLCIIFRREWLEKPIVRFLATLLTQ